MKTRQLLKEVHNQSKKKQEPTLYNGKIPLVIAQKIPKSNFDLNKVCEAVNKSIPQHLFYGIDVVYVGHLPEFDQRGINAMYSDGAIYVTNHQDDELDMYDDIIHELAHGVEISHNDVIYGDGELEMEFLQKRKSLFLNMQKHEESMPYGSKHFLETDFNLEFDEYLYKDVGYPKLRTYIQGIFTSCYSATSLPEYFAVNFTDFFVKGGEEVKKLCPVAYEKIMNLQSVDEQ